MLHFPENNTYLAFGLAIIDDRRCTPWSTKFNFFVTIGELRRISPNSGDIVPLSFLHLPPFSILILFFFPDFPPILLLPSPSPSLFSPSPSCLHLPSSVRIPLSLIYVSPFCPSSPFLPVFSPFPFIYTFQVLHAIRFQTQRILKTETD